MKPKPRKSPARQAARTSQLQTSIVRPGLRLIYHGTKANEPRRVLTINWLVTITAPATAGALRQSVVSMCERASKERIEGARHTFALSSGLEWEIGGSGS